jgi:2'-5' RNA ligase
MARDDDQPSFPGFEPERRPNTELPAHRFYLALKPDVSAAEKADETALRLKCENQLVGNPLKRENFHISLPLLWEGGKPPGDFVESVSARMQAVRRPSFEIVLDMAMSFRQPRRHLLVLGTTRSVANIYELNRQLVVANGFKTRRSSFNPHMTLLYTDKFVEKQPIEPIRWMAHEFVLVHSFVGLGRQEIAARWPLQ